MRSRRKDSYYLKAKARGYRSRAAYKLRELAERYRLIRPGDRVVDLGSWPGGWLQVARELAGPRGRVVGVDRVPLEPVRGTTILVGDLRDAEVQAALGRAVGGCADVALSDMAPKLTGIRDRDAAAAAELADLALEVGCRLLRPGGRLVVKLLAGAESDRLLAEARRRFRSAKLTRPPASRAGSTEMYLVALDFRGAREPA